MKWISVLLLFSFTTIQAQDHEEQKEEGSEHHSFKHHRVALMMSHTHVPKAFESADNNDAIIVPSWGLNYEYWFNHTWAVGLHNDMEIANYVIEDADGSELERKRPIIISIVGIFKPWKKLELIAGIGKEFEKHHNFIVYRTGLEYEIEVGKDWDIAPSLIFDFKEDLITSA